MGASDFGRYAFEFCDFADVDLAVVDGACIAGAVGCEVFGYVLDGVEVGNKGFASVEAVDC